MRDGRSLTVHRTVLISDLHLGSYRCDAASVLDFLDRHKTETLFLVGDVVDLWSFRRNAAWRPEHVAVGRRLVELSQTGTRIVLIPGNHDGPLVQLSGFGLPGVEVQRQAVFETARGERLLVVHGHEQDPMFGATNDLVRVACALGERVGEAWQRLERRGWLGARAEVGERWAELDGALPSRFERAVVEAAQRRGFDGVICGHSHRPADRMIEGVRYLNCGDWLASCTAITESQAGELELLHWGSSRVDAGGDEPAWAAAEIAAGVES